MADVIGRDKGVAGSLQRHDHLGVVAFSRNFTSAARSAAEPIFCSGIFVPGV
jgi:hypothetical protein